MNKDFIRNNSTRDTARGRVILRGFGDANVSLDDVGSKLKPDHAMTAHLNEKISLNNFNMTMKRKGWSMHQISFSSLFNPETKHYWSMTKISDGKGKNVTMGTALNVDPEGTLNSIFMSEEEKANMTAPPPIPKGCVPCSIIHTSAPQVRIDDQWGWAFDTPKK